MSQKNSIQDQTLGVSANSWYAIFVLVLLWLAYILSFIDRQVLALLIGPIREDFQISDTQFSLLHGLAFALFYTVLGIPIARLADRGNRRNIIVWGVAIWSLMTCLCGFAKNFLSLFFARVGVGVGEAALSPPAHSLLSDYFEAKHLPIVYSFYTSGIVIGSGTAYIIGGYIYDYFAGFETLRLTSSIAFSAWQATFIAVGLPGLALALLMLLIREPARAGVAGPQSELSFKQKNYDDKHSVAAVLAYIHGNGKAYYSLIGGVSLLSILGYGTMAWYPEFLQRSYALDRSSAGQQFGQVFIVAGLLGTVILASATQWLVAKGVRGAEFKLVLLVAVAEIVPAIMAPLMPSATSALWVASILVALQYGYFGIAIAALQRITPNEMRAQVSALMLFATNMLGLIVGPTLVAVLTDYVYRQDALLNLSLATTAALILPIAVVCLALGVKAYSRLSAQVE